MSRLLNIEEPAAAAPRPSMTAFLALGFRPLYLAGAAWALISIALWIFAPQVLDGPLPLVYWHAHEMLWGFIITIAVGFLLTASATWTGFNPLSGRPLGLLCLLWVVARAGFLAGGLPGFWIATAAELLFFLTAAASLMRVMVKGRSRRNYGLPVVMLALGAADLLYLLAALRGDYVLLMQRFDLGLIGMAVIALLIARRVIPFFSMRMVQGLQIPMLTRSGHVQMVFSALALAAGVLMQIVPPANGGPAFLPLFMAASLALTGLISLGQLLAWRPLAVLRKPMLWILYLGYAFIGIGLLAAAVQVSGLLDPSLLRGMLARSATHVHLIGMAGFCILIIGMLTRTALGHLGRPLALDRSMLASYWLMVAAVVFRLAALWPSAASQSLLHLAACAWILCMGLYLWRFAPMLIRPRPDKPAPAVAPPRAAAQPAQAR
ncbi:NnrS family protein [Castellaniella sp.]|uniref:NnrS family protein n=1 Tax=Castellaniella sp. TaxID=1955812 RepID=UPI002B003D65|nr:NnrS family protein [Castellaniella sp.]